MAQLRKRGEASKKTTIETAEKAAMLGIETIKAFLRRKSTDYKGALAGQKAVNAYIRLRRKRPAQGRLRIDVLKAVGKVAGLGMRMARLQRRVARGEQIKSKRKGK